ncbi:hypothetical protein C2845_PM04G34000 [Panicum miliaceum]|uniref:OVATE domain-containing protein n=1 Tax=Panicum miliaceum TaxID=4540 RepID=A0A3L6QNX0_PANMI|nr:hypothetical protein C2845_PM04G34000 [Panicum miliaceum]
MPLCCVECKPCKGCCLPGLFKSRQQLRRAFGKMKVGGTRRRRRAGSFSSVRAVFWPLMSMRSEADAAADSRPPASASTDGSVVSVGARAPSPSLDNGTPGAAASTTAARVLALQARLDEAPQLALTTAAPAAAIAKVSSIGVAAREEARAIVRHGEEVGDVEAACRSFERHLVEMLVEERKVMDLTDVEELLRCWEKLRCPAFVQLVGRFYGELCMDLFSARDADVSSDESAEALTACATE